MRRSKKTSKFRVTGLCEGNSPVTDEFPAQRASYAENIPFDDVIMECSQALAAMTLIRSNYDIVANHCCAEIYKNIERHA